jgi:hypothetical protein
MGFKKSMQQGPTEWVLSPHYPRLAPTAQALWNPDSTPPPTLNPQPSTLNPTKPLWRVGLMVRSGVRLTARGECRPCSIADLRGSHRVHLPTVGGPIGSDPEAAISGHESGNAHRRPLPGDLPGLDSLVDGPVWSLLIAFQPCASWHLPIFHEPSNLRNRHRAGRDYIVIG